MLTHTKYEEFKVDVYDFLIAIGVGLFYYMSQYFAAFPLELFGIDINNLNYAIRTIYLLIFQFFVVGSIIFVYKNHLIAHFKDFQKNKDIYFKKYFKFWIYMYAATIICNAIILIINGGDIANNQEGINELFNINPIYVYIASVIIAPILEELIFRFSLRKIFKTDTLFIIMSGLLFGCAHVVGQTESLIDYLHIIPYSIPGFVFGYIFVKTNNIFPSICMHLFHNGITIALQFFIMFFS